jgi:non-canonical (house-cleaning) NTP pyrophosphatase
MLTLEERKQGKEMKQVAEQMLHTKEGQKYNPIVAKMTEKQLAGFVIDLRRNMKLLSKKVITRLFVFHNS